MATAAPPNEKEAASQALVQRVREGSLAMQFGQAGLQLRHLEDAIAFAKQMIDGGLVPDKVTKPGAVIWMVQRGAELGIGPTAALDSFYIGPSGKPELYAKAALGICVARGALDDKFELWTEGEGRETVAYFRFRRKTWPESRLRKFAWKEAEAAKLAKPESNWMKWPQRMCTARVVAFAIKDHFSDVTLGCPIEGDREPIQGQVTEIERTLSPAPPDPLFEQLKAAKPETVDANWDDTLSGPQVEPDDYPLAPTDHVQGEDGVMPEVTRSEIAAAMFPLTDLPPRKPLASKKDQDWLFSLCRSHGMNDIQISQFVGNAGYERIDQIPADVIPGLMESVKRLKPKK